MSQNADVRSDTSLPSLADVVYLASVAIPPIVLAGMFLAAAFSWQKHSKESERALLQVFPDARDAQETNFATWYDQRTSKQDTLRVRKLIAAADSIYAQLEFASPGVPFEIQAAGEESPQREFIHRIALQFQPVLEELRSLDPGTQPIWLPMVFGDSPDQIRHGWVHSIPILIRLEAIDAIHQGDDDRAMEALKLLYRAGRRRSYGMGNIFQAQQGDSLIRDSLQHDVWSDQQLAVLAELASTATDWDADWEVAVQARLLCILPWLKDRHGLESLQRRYSSRRYRRFETMVSRSSVAPSEVQSLFESFAALSNMRGAGTKEHAEAAQRDQIQAGMPKTMDMTLDHWLKTPMMRGVWYQQIAASAAGGAAYFAQIATHQRWTQTAIAIKQFRRKMKRWPKELSELTEVGLPLETTLDYNGQPFRFAVDDGDAIVTLWNHSAPPPSDPNALASGVWSQSVKIR